MATLAWPIPLARVTSEFSPNRAPIGTPAGSSGTGHTGMDFAAVLGQNIPSAGIGTVTATGRDRYGALFVILDHGGGLTTWYWHLSRIDVVISQRIAQGHIIGGAGATGLAVGVHLHLETRINNIPVNPRRIIGTPHDNGPFQEDTVTMPFIRIQNEQRGFALIAPGYFKALDTEEEQKVAERLISVRMVVNAREFDLYRAMVLHGEVPKS